MRSISFLLFTFYLFINSTSLNAQTLNGKVMDQSTGELMANTPVKVNDKVHLTDNSGAFSIKTNGPEIRLEITRDGYDPYVLDMVAAPDEVVELGILFMEKQSSQSESDKANDGTFDLDDLEIFDNDQAVSSLLTASWDPFLSTAGFNFRVVRFWTRGRPYQLRLHLNNLPFNNLSDGRFFWGLWGGLNDVTRNQYTSYGLNSTDFSPGGIAGAGDIDLRATNQRKGTRLTLNYSNRSYKYRTMLTHNSGPQSNGWAYSFSVSRRWGDRGYIEGTYYDAYSYFTSVDKKLNEKHSINLTAFAAPAVRGRASATTQFMYDLAGSNFYNPNWGYQNGKVRNSREYRTHQPVITLRHDYKISDLTTLTTSIGVQTGKFGSTRLGWLDAPDPRSDYYGNLPYDNSENLSEGDLAALTERYGQESILQLDFDELYEINRNRQYQYQLAGLNGGTNVENVSAYVIEEQRFDNHKFVFHTNVKHSFNPKLSMQSGIAAQYDRNHNFKVLDDLLGGDFYLDIDGFALRDTNSATFIQNDIERPDRLLKEGDVFGYDYLIHNQNANVWTNLNYSLPKVDFTFSGQANHTRFWRDGKIANGKFPEFSKGSSDKASFTHGFAKIGATYKINGRNYISIGGGYFSQAPFSRNSFESPQTRNFIVDDLVNEKRYGGEASYILRHPKLNARLTGYYYNTEDITKSASFYFVNVNRTVGRFVNLITSGLDQISYGFELGIDYKLSQTLTLRNATAIGEHYINSRPNLTITVDNNAEGVGGQSDNISYLKGFNVSGIPQIASSFEIEYRSPNFWSVELAANYFDDIYIDPNAVRRTEILSTAISNNVDTKNGTGLSASETARQIVKQEKYDPIFTLDLYARKSWKLGDYFLALNLSVSNILDDTDIRSGGFEQLRFDFDQLDADRWAPKYYYSYGRTYSIGATLSI